MDELLTIVNDSDEVIGAKPYSEVHEYGLLHRGAVVLLFKDASYRDILILKRSPFVSNPGKLDIPGGHVIAGQTYAQAALNELAEEVFSNHRRYFDLQELFKIKKSDPRCNMFITVFRTVYAGLVSINPAEAEAYEFWNMDATLKKVDVSPEEFNYSTQQVLKRYGEEISKR